MGAQAKCSSSVTFDWYIITPLTHRERETQACGLKLNDGGSFLLETVNLISQHSSRNRKSNSARAALSISCLAAQVDKCTAELINSTYILDALMLFFFFHFFVFIPVALHVYCFLVFLFFLYFWCSCCPCGLKFDFQYFLLFVFFLSAYFNLNMDLLLFCKYIFFCNWESL